MYRDPQSLRPALVAGRLDLFVAQRSHAAVADAAGGEDLDHVGPIRLELPDVGADGVRVAGGAGHRPQRRQHARAGHVAAVYRVPQVGVERVAEALHRREAGHQGAVGVAHRVQHRLGGGFRSSGLVQPAVGFEVRRQMNVRVDPSGHDRQVGKVVVHRAAQAVDAGDRGAVHEDADVGRVSPVPSIRSPARMVVGASSWARPMPAAASVSATTSRVGARRGDMTRSFQDEVYSLRGPRCMTFVRFFSSKRASSSRRRSRCARSSSSRR